MKKNILRKIKKILNNNIYFLLILFVIISLSLFFIYKTKKYIKNDYYDIQISASNDLKNTFNAIKQLKTEKNIPLSQYDYDKTGMIGEDYNNITTTLGSIEAKRSTCDYNMAALFVKIIKEDGIKENDTIGVLMSGSFPALNFAMLSASKYMNLNLIIQSSIGSSTYGANNDNFSFPQMLNYIQKKGLTPYNSSLVSIGGDKDIGTNMNKEKTDIMCNELKNENINIFIEEDAQKNLKKRIEMYNDIDYFIAIGGNIYTNDLLKYYNNKN
ncbi:MAG: poly-gamma-glutamate system protein, partial [Eubacteriales bacterium]|nr:poly-gamma-glutamate system protein [Eubacteriales bacterium]